MAYQVPQDLLDDVDALQIVRADAQILFGHGLLNAHQPALNCPEWWKIAAMFVRDTKRVYGKLELSGWYDSAFESLYEHNVKECSKLFREPRDKRFREVINFIRLALVCIRKLAVIITYSKEPIEDLEVFKRMESSTYKYETTRQRLRPFVDTLKHRFGGCPNGDSKEFLKKVVDEIEVMTSVLIDSGAFTQFPVPSR
ncbi:hypothetical protein CJF31_00006321 [Rutstroemia sp. NJR-2017a BVV2]|nr:hypothetical protein CJF31_00006321 [Rutstroemia sp. NJR-2017a BVV2]